MNTEMNTEMNKVNGGDGGHQHHHHHLATPAEAEKTCNLLDNQFYLLPLYCSLVDLCFFCIGCRKNLMYSPFFPIYRTINE